MFRYTALTLGLWAAVVPGFSLAETSDAESLLIKQGYFWQAQDKPKRAAESWEKVLLLDASQPDALYGLGIIAVERAQLPRAQAYLQRLQAIEPLPRQALQLEQDIRLAAPANKQLLEQARLLVDNGEREKAVAVYRQALAGVDVSRAQLGESQGRLQQADTAPQQVAVSESQVDTALAAQNAAEAAVHQAELDLSYAKITAPADPPTNIPSEAPI